MKGPRKVVEKRNPERQRDSTRAFEPEEHPERQPRQKRYTTPYRNYKEVRVTRKIGINREQEVIDWVREHIGEYNGIAEDNPGIPHMLFERPADASRFADKLDSKFNILKEHLQIRAHR